MKTSTLRFSAMPVLVRLSATGFLIPGLGSTRMAIRICLFRMSGLSILSSSAFTSAARRSPSRSLYFSEPLLSV